MKLRAITLCNVRRFTDPVRIDGIADGVNVLSAPNEHGKSTVFDALRALFFVPHSSTKKDIRHLRPHAGGAPEVTAEIETGDGLFQLSKRWFGKAQARVTQDGRLVAQADEAEAWIARLLGDGAGGPSGLLWVRQGLHGLEEDGTSDRRAALEARRDLLSSVTGEVEAMTGGRRMDAALARCRAELATFATATGRPRTGGPWAQALAEVEALTDTRETLASRVAALQSALEARRSHRAELAEVGAPEAVANRAARLQAARDALTAAEAHAAQVATAEQALQTATLIAERAAGHLKALRDAQAARVHAEKADAAARAQLEQAGVARGTAEDALAEAARAQTAAEGVRARADATLRKVQALHAAQAARARRRDVEARLAQAEDARKRVEALQAAASIGPQDGDMDHLRDLAGRLGTARALRDAAATRVTMHYAEGRIGTVQHADGALADGGDLTIHADTVLHLDGLGRLTIHPGAGADGAGDVARAQADLDAALGRLGLATLEEAGTAHRKRKEATTRLTQEQASLKAHAPDGIDALQHQLAALPDMPGESGEDLPPLDAATRALQDATDRVAELQARVDGLRTRRDDLRAAHATATAHQENAARQLAATTEELTRLEAEDPAQIEAAATKAAEERAAAERALQAARGAAPDIAAARAAHARALSVEDAARARIGELRPAIAALDARIDSAAGEAVEERLQETEETLERADARLARIAREVQVLERLKQTLEDARAAARERYFEPIAGELRPLLHLLWPDAELHWADDTLLPQALIRDGQTEPIDILSGGTQEQVALLVRLAFARLLAKDGRHAPVILDDALVFTDDDRIERMFDALHRQAGDLQILVLSCRQRAFRDLGGRSLHIAPAEAP